MWECRVLDACVRCIGGRLHVYTCSTLFWTQYYLCHHSVCPGRCSLPGRLSQFPLRRSGLPAPRYVPIFDGESARASLHSGRVWPTAPPSAWATTPGGQLPRMILARLNEPHPQPHTTHPVAASAWPTLRQPPRSKAGPHLRGSPSSTTRLPHHGCLPPRPPPFQPLAVLTQDPRISPATAVLRRALLRKWHPTIITPDGPARPAVPTLSASHNGPGRADEHGGAEEIRQRSPSHLPPASLQQHFVTQRQSTHS